MTLRQAWRDFIFDPNGVGRHFTSIGGASESTFGEPMNAHMLENFLLKLSDTNTSIDALSDAVDLSRPGYAGFCQKHLIPLLDALSSERVGRIAVVGPAFQGHPLWQRTVLDRRTVRIPQTSYVSRLTQRSFALPENMLIRWLVDSLARGVNRLEHAIGSRALPRPLRIIRDACSQALSHDWFNAIEAPPMATSAMLTAGRRQRRHAYRLASALAADRIPREARDRKARWLGVLDLLRVNWLAPVETDDLFELYTLMLVIDVLRTELGLGEPIEYGLVLPGRNHVARYAAADLEVLVFFDQSPVTIMSAQSHYQHLLAAHEPSLGAGRRPDVVVVVRRLSRPPDVILIDAKETRDAGYIADSVYKAFGYIHDFSTVWSEPHSNPKVILLFPERVQLRATVKPSSLDVALVSSLDRESLAACLRSRIFPT